MEPLTYVDPTISSRDRPCGCFNIANVFQQPVPVQYRLLVVDLIEQAGEQNRHLATLTRDWINTRVGVEDLGPACAV